MNRLACTFVLLTAFITPLKAFAAELPELKEAEFWRESVEHGVLPPIDQRLPENPIVVDLSAKGRVTGQQGGTLRTMITRSKDIRQMVVYGYARLMGYDENYQLMPDILEDVKVAEGRIFTFKLRKGHKWSDGNPFTSADFQYWWDHVANNEELAPSGPPAFLKLDGELPRVLFPDETTVLFIWSKPNPGFLPQLAQARPPFIYRPAHFLKQFHADFADPDELAQKIRKKKVRSWAALHNKRDNMYKFDNHRLPTLQPWIAADTGKESRRQFVRNPYYHRIDTNGIQLPYIDTVEMSIVGRGLVAAKTNAGEADLQARGLNFKDVPILKKGETEGQDYKVFLWPNGTSSQIAIYPNLNHADPKWRRLLRDRNFRRALSLGIDRRMINRALYFGLASEGNMTVLPPSPFFSEENLRNWAVYNPEKANQILDEMGFSERRSDGLRLLPNGRPMRIVVETAGEREEVGNALQIIADTWRDIGIGLIVRPLDRDILRQHVFSGQTMAAVWYGWDNGIPTSATSPEYLAPRAQEFFSWPKWGQYYQTGGSAGEEVDMPKPKRLMQLASDWEKAGTDDRRSAIWREMLQIHAEEMYGIGILAEAPQPVVVSNRLKNVPEKALWAWDPGAHFGIHRPDEFFFSDGEAH
ncbi:MAG: ABC transporter substrate-binding protein [Rhodobacteraceae bacterium]|nr:ABC transporter substrate-binding protein [Paracoccaceae bacterium]